MIEYQKNIGNHLLEYRKSRHLTQEKMAEILEVSLKHYSEIERGITGVSTELLVKFHDTLGLSVDYLLFGDCTHNLSPTIVNTFDRLDPANQNRLNTIVSLIAELAEK